jgi:uncharacterized protein (DUF2062 family)
MKKRRARSKLYRLYRFAYLKCVRQHHHPEQVGRGAALGVFIGIFPTGGLGPLLAVFGAGFLKANRAAALASMSASGPLIPLWWVLSVVLGNQLVPPDWRIAAEILAQRQSAELVGKLFGTFLLGNTLVSLVVSGLAYLGAWWLASRYRRFRLSRRQARAATLAEVPQE